MPSINLQKSSLISFPENLKRDQFPLGLRGGAELEAEDCASAKRIAELLEGLGAGGVPPVLLG